MEAATVRRRSFPGAVQAEAGSLIPAGRSLYDKVLQVWHRETSGIQHAADSRQRPDVRVVCAVRKPVSQCTARGEWKPQHGDVVRFAVQ